MLVHSQDVVVISDDESDENGSLHSAKSPNSVPRNYASNQDIDLWNQISQYTDNDIAPPADGTPSNKRQAPSSDASFEIPKSPEPGLSRQLKRLRTADLNGNVDTTTSPLHNPPQSPDVSDDVVEIVSSDEEEPATGINEPDTSSGAEANGGEPPALEQPDPSTEQPVQSTEQPSLHEDPGVSSNVNGNTTHHDEDSSDEEIAVLSKEEAEKSGKFKASSFENMQRNRPAAIPRPSYQPNPAIRMAPSAVPQPTPGYIPPVPGYNQPVPLLYPHAHMSPAEAQEIQQDQKARQHFHEQTDGQLRAYDARLTGQIHRFQHLKDSYLEQVGRARTELQRLSPADEERRSELIREVHLRLQDAESAITRVKKIRRYQSVLHTVLDEKARGIGYAPPPQYPYGAPQPMPLPGAYHSVSHQPVYPQPTRSYTSDNPYEDNLQLQQLLKDACEEEQVEGMENTPTELTVQLLNHQRRGLHWLLKREKSKQGCILADDMGLGKTVQAIALLMANKSEDKKCKTTLIVGPVSLLRQWAAELKAKVHMEHKPRVAFYHGTEKKKLNHFAKLSRFDVVLTSYTTLASEFKNHFAEVFEEAQVTSNQNVLPDLCSGGRSYVSPFYSSKSVFYRIILDEAQYIKSKVSLTSKASACLKAEHRLCLTGTPMQNSIDELYPILRFLKTKPYDNESKFRSDISVPIKSNTDLYDDYDRNTSMKKLRAILSAIMLRRTKDSKIDGKPLLELPKKTVDLTYVKMGPDEQEFYKELEKGVQKKARKLLLSKSRGLHSNILTLLLRLRQACIHQYLVEVGDMNAEERSMGETQYLDWKTMFTCCQNLSARVSSRIQSDLRKTDNEGVELIDDGGDGEVQLTCPSCFDVVDENSIVILHPCGHMICEGCIENIFVEDASGNYVANCLSCKQEVTSNDLIEYSVFDEVVNKGRSYSELEMKYGSKSRHTTTTAQKIKKLTAKYGGFLTSAKMAKTLSLVQEVTEKTDDEKIIVFSHFTGAFDLMGMVLNNNGISYLRYDGSMNIDLKNSTIRRFYSGPERVLLISLKAGNVGLTLTCASHVIIMDPFWNPFVEEQAMDRAHRLGQQKPVHVYKFLIQDSVEDRIMDLQKRKKELVESALDESALKKSSSLGRAELGFLFGLNSMNSAI